MTYGRVVITKFGGPEVVQVIEEPQLPEPGSGGAVGSALLVPAQLGNLRVYGTASGKRHEFPEQFEDDLIDSRKGVLKWMQKI